jgi:hypothetical protein
MTQESGLPKKNDPAGIPRWSPTVPWDDLVRTDDDGKKHLNTTPELAKALAQKGWIPK